MVLLLSFQVHENGLISFGSTLIEQTPASFPLTNKALAAAPYWADVYTERGGRVWYRKTTDDAIVSRATRDVIRVYPRYTGYMASWVVIVTWNEVTFYGASGKHTQNVSYTEVVCSWEMSSNESKLQCLPPRSTAELEDLDVLFMFLFSETHFKYS